MTLGVVSRVSFPFSQAFLNASFPKGLTGAGNSISGSGKLSADPRAPTPKSPNFNLKALKFISGFGGSGGTTCNIF